MRSAQMSPARIPPFLMRDRKPKDGNQRKGRSGRHRPGPRRLPVALHSGRLAGGHLAASVKSKEEHHRVSLGARTRLRHRRTISDKVCGMGPLRANAGQGRRLPHVEVAEKMFPSKVTAKQYGSCGGRKKLWNFGMQNWRTI